MISYGMLTGRRVFGELETGAYLRQPGEQNKAKGLATLKYKYTR